MRLRQLPLDLPTKAAFQPEDFLATACNRAAVDLVERWPDWLDRCCLLVGPVGAGKSHLAAVWAERAGARIVPAASLRTDDVGALPDHLVIEDIDATADETALFHIINRTRERRGHLLLTASVPVTNLSLVLPDLVSRLKALPIAIIDPPDDRLMAALIVKQLSDRQVIVEPAVIDYLVARIERSYAQVRTMVAALDRAALAERRAITVPLARQVLEAG